MISLRTIDLLAALAALAMAIVSVVIRDADKAPLYLLLAYAFLRISARRS